jgi:hypothetical protein
MGEYMHSQHCRCGAGRGVVWGVVWHGVVWCVERCGVWRSVVHGAVWSMAWCGACVVHARWRAQCGALHNVVRRVVWCGVVWCGVVWCGVVWCGVVRFDAVWHGDNKGA